MNHDEDITEISDHRDLTIDDPEPKMPDARILRGNPSDEDLAALATVLAGIAKQGGNPGPQEFNPWGSPVDKLRYPVTSWQLVTLLERTHMRR
ncbi:acyl-CoA carboxylase subunit epsilon [Mycolicibacterium brumae]|uniref:Acyl-CoA carboxylase subunit epsilon n=1 Tax=Mycolicibacterium brumae TaxID=85968 RepID=A0A2G5PBZ8_9MYCO|nr:acyl-CoA carboxylase subunit epsilon [Mycolicibacterium brumae]MCV7193250.1 acyl-CoA carboxylase subunit epsilon [Mycolicibacterium brumae]PIB75533.1 acyl-CoA carboxylase subunit epsilon [Mycolicibacterium brumae]RWA16686.1 hypothetical protein MBRU_08145 [Mycolicibacterium brumae DSM 44177]UWW09905.1 acyl-CoA carboxylase subunit epsilon [Mycolicibacterium brumae]